MTLTALPPLWSPEELEIAYDGRIKARRIRSLVAAGRVTCTRGRARRVLFTADQVPALLAAMSDPAPAQTTAA